jgi:dienelactone hydrolase
MKWIKIAGVFIAVLVAGGVALVAMVKWDHGRPMTLPKPTGRFAVGRTSFIWTNDALTDDLAPTPGTKRTVFVGMWYPASTAQPAAPAEYMPQAWRVALQDSLVPLMRDYLTRDFALVRSNSLTDPAVSTAQPSWPVVIMRTGTELSTLAEDLASHGYCVVGFDAPYRSGMVVFPDGHVVKRQSANNPETMSYEAGKQVANKLLPMWTTDASFVVDQLERLNESDPSGKFKGRLDIAKLGIFGHSFGGATALQFCHDDRRCRAAMDIDGMPFGNVVLEGSSQPFLFLLSDHTSELSTTEGREVLADIHSVYDHSKGSRHVVMIRGANHFTFTDQMVTKSSYFIRAFLLVRGGPGALRGLAIARAYLHTFFDVYLKGAPVDELAKIRQSFPEVQTFDGLPPAP